MIPPTGSFPREVRIRRSSEFREISAAGRRHMTEGFVVLVRPTRAQSGVSRLGVTVSRKVGNAVVRNRVKRCIREWFRRDRAAIGLGLDVLVIARPAAAGMTGSDAFAALARVSGALR